MKYILDSDVLSDLYDWESENFAFYHSKFEKIQETDEIYVSILSLFEWEYSYCNSPEQIKLKIRDDIQDIKDTFTILSLKESASFIFGELKKSFVDSHGLKKTPAKKYNIDIMLASTAIAENCILVSPDKIYSQLKSFKNEFQYQNWLD